MSSADQVWKRTHQTFLNITLSRLHQTNKDLEIVFAADPKNGLEEAVFHRFEEITKEILRRTDKIAGDEKNVR